MEKIICPECKTENEGHFRYCKNCGTQLSVEEEAPVEEIKTPPVSEPIYEARADLKSEIPQEINEISKKEFDAFLGKNSHNIYNKFLKMEFSGSKVSWCWPVFFLTFFCGFLGSALWFLYRKMFKPAVALILAGVLLLGVQTALNYDANKAAASSIMSIFGQVLGESTSDVANPELFPEFGGSDEIIEPATTNPILSTVSEVLGTAENFVGAIVLALFAMGIYKKHTIGKIREQWLKHGESQYYLYTLSLCGGTSGGLLALGIVIYVVAINVSSFIPIIF